MLTETVEDLRWNMTENKKLHRALVCDCPEPSACYCEGYAQGKDKAYFEMSNFDWTQHAKGCGCEPCIAFGKVLVRMLGHMATSEDQEARLVAFHFTSWLNGSLETEKSA